MKIRAVLMTILFCSVVTSAGTPRTDIRGDPLPEGAIGRLGSIRFQHGAYVRGLAMSPDGKMLASLGYRSRGTRGLILWDSQTGKALKRIDIPGSNGLSVDWSPGGNSIVFADSSQAVYICNIHTTKKRKIKIGSYCYRVEYSEDGNSVFVASRNGLYKHRVRDGKRTHKFGGVSGAAILAVNGGYVASANNRYDRKKGQPIYVYNAKTNKKIHTLTHGRTGFRDIAISSDGKYLAAGPSSYSRKGIKVPIWSLQTGKKVRTLTIQSRYIRRMEFVDDTHKLVTLGMSGTITVTDVDTGKRLKRMTAGSGSMMAMAVSADGKYIAAAGNTQRISVRELKTGKSTHSAPGHSHRITSIAFSPDGRQLASASYDKTVRIWDLETYQTRHVLSGHTSYVFSVAWSADKKHVASVQVSGDAGAILWDPETGRKIRRMEKTPTYTMDLVFRADGKELVAAGRRGEVAAWTVPNGKRVYRANIDTPGKRRYFYSVTLSPHGHMLAAFGREYLKLLDLRSKKAFDLSTDERIMYGQQNSAFSPDGYLMAWSGVQRTHVIETISGQEVLSYRRDSSGRHAVVFSRDGRYLATTRKVDDINVHDLALGKRVVQFKGPMKSNRKGHTSVRYGASCLQFSPDGSLLASGGAGGVVLLWDFASALKKHRDQGEIEADLGECWDELANHDARRAYGAYWKLSRKGEDAIAFLADAMQPVSKPRRTVIRKSIDRLDDEGYQSRKDAYATLARFGPVVKRELQQAMKRDMSLAGRRRVEQLLRLMDSPTSRSPSVLRQLRAVRILQNVGGEKAREILRSLSEGVKEAPQTQAARRALKMLRGQSGEK